MRLANAFCRFVEAARGSTLADPIARPPEGAGPAGAVEVLTLDLI
jgi:hypothetical protein